MTASQTDAADNDGDLRREGDRIAHLIFDPGAAPAARAPATGLIQPEGLIPIDLARIRAATPAGGSRP